MLHFQQENETLRDRIARLEFEESRKDGIIVALTAERDKALEDCRIFKGECTTIALHLTNKNAGVVRELNGKHREELGEKDAEIATLEVKYGEAMARIADLEAEVADWKEEHMKAMMDIYALIELHLDGHKNSQKRFDRLKRSLYRALGLDAAVDIGYDADHGVSMTRWCGCSFTEFSFFVKRTLDSGQVLRQSRILMVVPLKKAR